MAQSTPSCTHCGKAVFLKERLGDAPGGRALHAFCFKCTTCGRALQGAEGAGTWTASVLGAGGKEGGVGEHAGLEVFKCERCSSANSGKWSSVIKGESAAPVRMPEQRTSSRTEAVKKQMGFTEGTRGGDGPSSPVGGGRRRSKHG